MFIEISQNSQESLFFNRVAGWIFIKNEALAHLPYCEFCETSTNCFFTEHLQEIASRNSKTIHTAKVYYKFFYSAWKETTQIPSKLATAKKPFSPVFIILLQLALINDFLFYVIIGIVTLRFSTTAMYLRFLKHVIPKKSVLCFLSPRVPC